MESKELAELCLTIAEGLKASDGQIVDLQGLTSIADYFVIVTVSNDRQAYAIADKIREETTWLKRKVLRQSSEDKSGWVVVDCSDVIVHIFLDHVRRKYQLEELWQERRS